MTTPRAHDKKNRSEKISAAIICVIFLMFICNMMSKESSVLKSTAYSTLQRKSPFVYIPASTEDYTMTHLVELGFDKEMAEACKIYQSPEQTTQENFEHLLGFRRDLDNYIEAIENFDGKIKDIRENIRNCPTCDRAEICKAL